MTSLDVAFPPPWAVFNPSVQDGATIDALCADLAAENGVDAADAVRSYLIQLAPALREARIDALAALVVAGEPPGADELPARAPAVALAVAIVGTVGLQGDLDLNRQLLGAAQLNAPETIETDTGLTELAGRTAARCALLRHAIELRDSEGVAPLTWEVRYAIPVAEDVAAQLRFMTPSVGYLDEFTEMFDAIAASVIVRPGPPAEPERVPGARQAG